MQEYNSTDKQIHWLSQIIAKVNRAFVPKKEDDSHTSLYFDSVGRKLAGRWIDTPQGRIILSLDIIRHRYEWLDKKYQNRASINIDNKEIEVLEKEVIEYPKKAGLNCDKLLDPLHFEIPDYKILSVRADELTVEGLNNWCRIREMANNACLAVSGYLQAESEIRIWPHHFDTGIYSQVSDSLGIGFGLAMEDAMVGEPYFYLAGYSSGTPIDYEGLPALKYGRWIRGEQWNGAILPLSEVYDLPAEPAFENLKRYIKQSADWFMKI